MKYTAALAGLAVAFAGTAGAWTLDSAGSAISYVTMKNGEIAEPNLLSGLSGSVSEDGAATVEIALSSVETYIDIRNERMREFLFQVADFPVATVTAALDLDDIADLPAGGMTEASFEVTIATNGTENSYDAMAFVTRASDDRVMVTSKQPIIVYADEMGYEGGLAKLQELAGLDSIQPSVPVSFNLTFTR
ncbi:MAG: YceI family protein [Pseudomonadota bacterium]